MSQLATVTAGQGADTVVNQNFEAVAAAAMYGRRAPATAGLTWAYYGGRGFGNDIADGTVTLTSSATNYVVASRSTGAVSVATSTTNWDDATNYFRVRLIVAGTASITAETDYREFGGGGGGGGGSTAWGDLTGIPAPIQDIAALTDPGADRLLMWDDSEGEYTHATLGSNLSFSGTTLNASGGGGRVDSVVAGTGISVDNTDPANPVVSASGGGGGGVSLGDVNVFTKNQSVATGSLTDGATISVDASLSNNFKVTLGGNRTLANPTNLTEGMILNFAITQDGAGSRTLAYGSAYKFPGGIPPVLTTAGNAKDFLSCYYDGAVLLCNLNKGFA